MSAPRPAKADRPPRGSSKVAKPHLLESAPKAAALRRPPPQGGGETLGAARRLFLMSPHGRRLKSKATAVRSAEVSQ